MSFFAELKRRNVVRVGIAYIVASWLLLQLTEVLVELLALPEVAGKFVVLLLVIGFVPAVIFAWAFELTPEGLKREREVDRDRSITPQTGRKLDYAIIALLAVGLVYFAWESRFADRPGESAAATAGAAKSIAVLPFADLSQAGDQEWFADGLAEEILNALSRTPDLLVSSRTSSFRYKGSELDIPQIASELGVAHVLEGSVRSGGDRIRVTAQLIRASDGFHVWSENYDRDVADMISIQEDLARNIAKALETTMDPEALAEMSQVGTRSVEAYEVYLRAQELRREAWNAAEGAELQDQSFELYERARNIDPGFAAAHMEAAEYWKVQLTPSRTDRSTLALGPRQMLAEYMVRVEQAIEHAPSATDRIGFRAHLAEIELRLNDSIRLYKEYLGARPNDEYARARLLQVADMAARQDIQREELAHWQARALTDLSAANVYANEAYRIVPYAEAADFGLRLVERWRTNDGILYQVHRTLMWAGRYAEADRVAARYFQANPGPNNLIEVREACANGDRAAAEAILARIDTSSGDGLSEAWHVLMLLGRKQDAYATLQPLEEAGVPYLLATQLGYHKFDPKPFPSVMAVLEREGIQRPPPAEIPFQCPPPEQTSIAVLPFVNMSPDADNEYFSDGIAEEILNVLARIPTLKVAARTSAFAFKGSNAKVADIAHELGVNHVLEGSVRKAGEQVRVTAQLIKADDGFHLWSETYDRELTNIFAIQDDIAQAIAAALEVSLQLRQSEAGNLTGTTSIQAYEHYLQGMQLWHLRTVATLNRAIEEFEAAIRIDPDFARAHAGLALVWAVLDGYQKIDVGLTMAETQAAARRALALDPENVEALTAMGLAFSNERAWERADEYFLRAIELNPSFATAHQWFGRHLWMQGKREAGLERYRIAWSLDPRARIIGYNLAYRLDEVGRRPEAIALLNEVLAFAPEFPDGLGLMMTLHLLDGRCEQVAVYGERLTAALAKTVDATSVYVDLCQPPGSPGRARALAAIGEWRDIDFAAPDHPTLSYAVELALILSLLGEPEAALRLFRQEQPHNGPEIDWLVSQNFRPRVRAFLCLPEMQALLRPAGDGRAAPAVDCG